MTPLYYQYISKTKIDMLYEQLNSKGSKITPQLSPIVKTPVVEFGLEVKREANNQDTTIHRVINVLKKLNENKLLKPLSGTVQLESKYYYQDKHDWHNGLVTWKDFHHGPMNAYFLLRKQADSLILLIGSSIHILGEIVTTPTMNFPSTDWIDMYELRNWIAEWAKSDEKFNKFNGLQLPSPQKEDWYSLLLTRYALNEIQELPVSKTMLTFKIYKHYDIGKSIRELAKTSNNSPSSGLLAKDILADFMKGELFRVRHLYLGSPLYTARE